MKVLIASTPATGHLNPLLAIGCILIAEGHEVVGLSGSALRGLLRRQNVLRATARAVMRSQLYLAWPPGSDGYGSAAAAAWCPLGRVFCRNSPASRVIQPQQRQTGCANERPSRAAQRESTRV